MRPARRPRASAAPSCSTVARRACDISSAAWRRCSSASARAFSSTWRGVGTWCGNAPAGKEGAGWREAEGTWHGQSPNHQQGHRCRATNQPSTSLWIGDLEWVTCDCSSSAFRHKATAGSKRPSTTITKASQPLGQRSKP
eukprot:355302-Chlamydomonas_euryale.AAC.4